MDRFVTKTELAVYADSEAHCPPGSRVLTKYSYIQDIRKVVETAEVLVILDAMSFPYELFESDQWEIPLVFLCPVELAPDDLMIVFGRILFEKITFFDRVICPNDTTWTMLAAKYKWAESLRLTAAGTCATQILEAVEYWIQRELQYSFELGEVKYEPCSYWKDRGAALASCAPAKAVGSVRHGIRANKAMHVQQAYILWHALDPLLGSVATRQTRQVLEIGSGVGRWAYGFRQRQLDYMGVDISPDMIRVAQQNYPLCRFEVLNEGLDIPCRDECKDICMTVTVLHHNELHVKRKLVRQMFRITRPGGLLVFLEDFVAARKNASATVYPLSILAFNELLFGVTAGRITLEFFQAIKYRHMNQYRSGLLIARKMAIPLRR